MNVIKLSDRATKTFTEPRLAQPFWRKKICRKVVTARVIML